VKLAEGEELGSNLLHLAQSSLGDPGGLGSFWAGSSASRCSRRRSSRLFSKVDSRPALELSGLLQQFPVEWDQQVEMLTKN
jgi:hypothetical protein